MKKLTIILALLLIFALAIPALAAFPDVPSDHWAYETLESLAAAGVVIGYPDGEFKGDRALTRYEMAMMINRTLDNLQAEFEARDDGFSYAQVQEIYSLVENHLQANMAEEFTAQQAEEVTEMVEMMLYEFRNELRLFGRDIEDLVEDVEVLEAKVAAMEVPEDNVEFAVSVKSIFEAADYPDDAYEIMGAGILWADGDALDLDLPTVAGISVRDILQAYYDDTLADLFAETGIDPGDAENELDGFAAIDNFDQYVLEFVGTLGEGFDWEDADDLPSEKRFWQEIGFDVYANLGDARFNLEMDTLVNVFTEEKSAFGYRENDENDFVMDNALLTVDYADTTIKLGDLLDYGIARYFVDEEDLQGISAEKNYLDIDWTFLVAGLGSGNTEDIYGLTAVKAMDFATVAGRAYQVRLADDQLNVLGLAVSDLALTDAITVGGEVAFSDETEGLSDGSDFLFAVDGEFLVSDELRVNAMFETVGEDFFAWLNDLEEDNDYDKAVLEASFILDENNTVSASYTWVDYTPGDENKQAVELRLDNDYGDFANYALVEYTRNDKYTDDYDTRVIELGTEYAWDDLTTVGAAFVNKNEDGPDYTVISYNYLKGHLNRQLSDNAVWNLEAKWIDGEVFEEIEATSSALTTSLTVKF